MSTKRKVLSVIEKVAIIKDSESGIKNIAICKKYGLSSSTVSTLLKNKEPLLHAYERNMITSKRLKKCSKADLDEVLFRWYIFQKNAGLPTNCLTMRHQAEIFAFQLGYENFSCTNGWLQRFRIRHNIFSPKKNSETMSESVHKPSMHSRTVQTLPASEFKKSQNKVFSLKKEDDDDCSILLNAKQSIFDFYEESKLMQNNFYSSEKNDEMLERVNEPSVCLSIGQSLPEFVSSKERTIEFPDERAAESIKSEDSAIQNNMCDLKIENIQSISPSSECNTTVLPVLEVVNFDCQTEMLRGAVKQEIKSEVVDSCIAPTNTHPLISPSITIATDCIEKLEYFFKSTNQKDSEVFNAISVIRRKLLNLGENKINDR